MANNRSRKWKLLHPIFSPRKNLYTLTFKNPYETCKY